MQPTKTYRIDLRYTLPSIIDGWVIGVEYTTGDVSTIIDPKATGKERDKLNKRVKKCLQELVEMGKLKRHDYKTDVYKFIFYKWSRLPKNQ